MRAFVLGAFLRRSTDEKTGVSPGLFSTLLNRILFGYIICSAGMA